MPQRDPDRLMHSPARRALWRDARMQAIGAQIIVVLVVALALYGASAALQRSLARRHISLDWRVFGQTAGFELSALQWTLDLKTFRVKRFDPTSTNAEAMIAGLFNTVQVAVIGIVVATLLGTLGVSPGCPATGWWGSSRWGMWRRSATRRCSCNCSSGTSRSSYNCLTVRPRTPRCRCGEEPSPSPTPVSPSAPRWSRVSVGSSPRAAINLRRSLWRL